MQFRDVYAAPPSREERGWLICDDPGKTQQHQKDDADINVIVARFGLTATLPESVRLPTYQDFDAVFDFQSAMNAVVAARETFMSLPAEVRAEVGNDPQAFLEFCSQEANHNRLKKLGLLKEDAVYKPYPDQAPAPPAPPGGTVST